MKARTLTDRELKKWNEIIGKDMIYYLHYTGKIKLSSIQFDILKEFGTSTDKTMYEVLKICKMVRKVKEEK